MKKCAWLSDETTRLLNTARGNIIKEQNLNQASDDYIIKKALKNLLGEKDEQRL